MPSRISPTLAGLVPRSSALGWVGRRAALFACALLFAPGTSAAPFVLELPELVRPIGDPLDRSATLAIPAHFDFGQPFLSVDAVFLEVEATLYAGEYDFCGFIFDPQPCTHVLELLGLFARLDNEGGSPFSIVTALSYSDELHVPSASGTARSAFDYSLHGSFDFLLDGEGELTLHWNRVFTFPDRIIMDFHAPYGEIHGARLILEATPIPEPSVSSMTAIALAILGASVRLSSLRQSKKSPRSG